MSALLVCVSVLRCCIQEIPFPSGRGGNNQALAPQRKTLTDTPALRWPCGLPPKLTCECGVATMAAPPKEPLNQDGLRKAC